MVLGMRTSLTILLLITALVPGCDKLGGDDEKKASPSSNAPAQTVDFVVDGEGVFYATRGADGKIHNTQTLEEIPLAERGTTFVYVENETANLLGDAERYVANLADATAGDRETATLRGAGFVEASEKAGLAGARTALHVADTARPDETDEGVASPEALRRGTPESAGRAATTSDDSGIKIESVGGDRGSNSLGFAESKNVGSRAVTVYYAEWCGVCDRAMNWMDRNGVDYRAVDIEASDANRREMVEFCREKGKSPNSVPTIRVGDQIMKGWNASAFKRMARL
jgi:glutaredoxin